MRADYFSADIRELVETFGRHGVRFLLVGGEAVIYHGYPRLTGDVDFWYEQVQGNVDGLHQALLEFWGGSVPGVEDARLLLEPKVVVQFGRPPNRVDLLSAIDGVTFSEAWPNRVEESLDFSDGRQVALALIGPHELLRNKRASGRHKDLDDVEHLAPLHEPADR